MDGKSAVKPLEHLIGEAVVEHGEKQKLLGGTRHRDIGEYGVTVFFRDGCGSLYRQKNNYYDRKK